MAYTAGGSLTLRRPQGAAALPGQAGALGAQLTLAGGSVDLDGAIALASGKLKIEAERDLRLARNRAWTWLAAKSCSTTRRATPGAAT